MKIILVSLFIFAVVGQVEATRERSTGIAPAIDQAAQIKLETRRVTKEFADAYVKTGKAMEATKAQQDVYQGQKDVSLKALESKKLGQLLQEEVAATKELNETHKNLKQVQKNPKEAFKDKWFMQGQSTRPGTKLPDTKIPEKKSMLDKIKDKLGIQK
jgi:hypothetical protein